MKPPRRFSNRQEGGRLLAEHVARLKLEDPLVLALPRGGVPVALPVARRLEAPLEVWIARKLGLPTQPEVGMGAVAEGGEVFVDAETVRRFDVTAHELREVVREALAQVEVRAARYRHGHAPPGVAGRCVVLVDDGVATGGTARAAIRSLRKHGATRLVLAAPVGARDVLAWLADEADEVVCPLPVVDLGAVGAWYDDFTQVQDEEVVAVLDREHPLRAAGAHGSGT